MSLSALAGPSQNEADARASTSMSEILLEPLNQLQTLSQQLFLSLGPPQARPPPPPSISSFLSVDAALAAAVQLSRIHQVKQRKIEQLKGEVLDLHRRWRLIVQELEEGRKELGVMVKEGDERIKAIEDAKAGMFISATRPSQRPLSCSLQMLARMFSCYPLPRTTCICTKPFRLHIGASQHAGLDAPRPAPASSVLPAVPERRKDAARTYERRSAARPARRNPFSGKT